MDDVLAFYSSSAPSVPGYFSISTNKFSLGDDAVVFSLKTLWMKICNIEHDLSNTSCPTPRIIGCIRVDTSLSPGTRKKFELLSLKSTLQIMSVFSVLVNCIVNLKSVPLKNPFP
jgi:hypothetical protein